VFRRLPYIVLLLHAYVAWRLRRPVALDDPVYMKMREDPRSSDVATLPRAESVQMATERAWPFLQQMMAGSRGEDSTLLVVTHGNIIRGLCAKLDGQEGEALLQMPVPNAVPIIYEIGGNMMARRRLALPSARVQGAA
jgi:bisphosphoglycerate-dependent phosphoglycerate mutase